MSEIRLFKPDNGKAFEVPAEADVLQRSLRRLMETNLTALLNQCILVEHVRVDGVLT